MVLTDAGIDQQKGVKIIETIEQHLNKRAKNLGAKEGFMPLNFKTLFVKIMDYNQHLTKEAIGDPRSLFSDYKSQRAAHGHIKGVTGEFVGLSSVNRYVNNLKEGLIPNDNHLSEKITNPELELEVKHEYNLGGIPEGATADYAVYFRTLQQQIDSFQEFSIKAEYEMSSKDLALDLKNPACPNF